MIRISHMITILLLAVCLTVQTALAQDIITFSGLYNKKKEVYLNKLYRWDFCSGELISALCHGDDGVGDNASSVLPVRGLSISPQDGIIYCFESGLIGLLDTSWVYPTPWGDTMYCRTIGYDLINSKDGWCEIRNINDPDYCFIESLTNDGSLYGFWMAGRVLVKLRQHREADVNKWISEMHFKGHFGPGKEMHSITYRDGELYGIHKNEFYHIDTADPSKSKLLWTFPIDVSNFTLIPNLNKDNYSHLHLESIQTKCGEWRTYLFVAAINDYVGPYRKGIYLLNVETGETRLVLDMAGRDFFMLLYGQSFFPGYYECNLTLDLDGDDSERRPPLDYQWSGCALDDIPVSDQDVMFENDFSGDLDSVTLELTGVLDAGQEYLSAGICPRITVRVIDDRHLTLDNTGGASAQDFLDCIRQIRLKLTAQPPSEGTRVVRFVSYTCGQVSDTAKAFLQIESSAVAGSDSTFSLCPIDTIIDLNQYLAPGVTTGGRWEPKGPLLHFPPDPSGMYCYIVEINGCGSDTACFNIDISAPLISRLQDTIAICDGQSAHLDPKVNARRYRWSTGQTSPTIDVDQPGTYSVEFESASGCPFYDSVVIVLGYQSYTDLGDIDICEGDSIVIGGEVFRHSGLQEVILQNQQHCDSIISFELQVFPTLTEPIQGEPPTCLGDSILLRAHPTLHNIVWSNGDTSHSLRVDSDGVYSLTARDEHDCPVEATYNVTFLHPPQVGVQYLSEHCKGLKDGRIAIHPSGQIGNKGLTFSLNGNIVDSTQLNHLPPGSYDLVITNADGCSVDYNGQISSGGEIEVDLGPDIVLDRLDTTLHLLSLISKGPADSILWWVEDQLYSQGEDSIDLYCDRPLIVRVVVIDSHGCSSEDILYIKININRKVFIPNTFTPNSDGLNERFEVFTSDRGAIIEEMHIYDRWGEQVYLQKNLRPIDDSYRFWDGTFQGKGCLPGVYVYTLLLRNSSGEVTSYSGEITLIR